MWEITLTFGTVPHLRVAASHVGRAVLAVALPAHPRPHLGLLDHPRHATSPNPLVPMAMKDLEEEVRMALAMTHVRKFQEGESL